FLDEARDGAADAGTELIGVEPEAFAATLDGLEPTTEIADTDAEDTAVILYTSGTTGKPKGAELSHRNLDENSEIISRTTLVIDAGDVGLGALPLFHTFGATGAMNAAMRVAPVLTLVPKFDPGEALATIERDGVTHFYGVPTMYGARLHHPEREKYDASTLRLCKTGGASMPVEVLHGFEKAFDTELIEGYGLSETSPVASSGHPNQVRKPGSIGTPIEKVEMRIVDEDGKEVPQGEVGEIVIRGHNIMKGYWNRPDATAEAMRGGWFHSGDLARTDEDGYFFIVDRKKELIIRGGYNVYPREVEEALYEHPAVAEVAVVGIAHDSLGEEVGAAVALRKGASVDPDELRDYVKARVAAYKYPRRIWLVDELPKGATGKVQKRDISAPTSEAHPDHGYS